MSLEDGWEFIGEDFGDRVLFDGFGVSVFLNKLGALRILGR